jgi:hypothetical protein
VRQIEADCSSASGEDGSWAEVFAPGNRRTVFVALMVLALQVRTGNDRLSAATPIMSDALTRHT